MADHAFDTQLPSMVRKPKAVWPGLVKMGMYQKQIAGDGKLAEQSIILHACWYLTCSKAIVSLHPSPTNSTAPRLNTPRYVQALLTT